jgi:hypothetical protein
MSNYNPPCLADRPDGFETLVFHRGKWVHVKWSTHGWSLGYGGPFLGVDENREWAPLLQKPIDADGFYVWKN